MRVAYRKFVRTLIRNYLAGSTIAVAGVGVVFIFTTLHISGASAVYVLLTLAVSLVVMFAAELIVFRLHLAPIRAAVVSTDGQAVDWTAAYRQTHRFPVLTMIRIAGPHWLGLSVPAVLLSLWGIRHGLLKLPISYVGYALLGSVLVAGMHAMIEFYLSTETIRPMLAAIGQSARDAGQRDPSLNGEVLATIRSKFVSSSILIGTFPLLLFALATQIRLINGPSENGGSYWHWAIIVLVIGIAFSAIGATLLARNVQHPIDQLQGLMQQVESGKFQVQASDLYSDEFSRLVSGFNRMVNGLHVRDELNEQLLDSYFATLAAALDARDPYTAGHSVRVATYAVQIGQSVGLAAEELSNLRKSALLHDIGKIGVSDQILQKDGRLTPEEFAQMQQHPVRGELILQQVQPTAAMAPLLPGVRSHHERYDGGGYPDGTKGEEIPAFGRIIAVADAFDAMTSDRPYRQGMPKERAIRILQEGMGSQWDPVYASAFVSGHQEQTLLTHSCATNSPRSPLITEVAVTGES